MQITVATVSGKARSSRFMAEVREYADRIGAFCELEARVCADERVLLQQMDRRAGRSAPYVILLDSRGKVFSSEQFAGWLGRERDGGRQSIVFAIGPANGWSEEARGRADLLLSLGAMTLPHELARVVLMEQVYRAFTILAGHPYHTGH